MRRIGLALARAALLAAAVSALGTAAIALRGTHAAADERRGGMLPVPAQSIPRGTVITPALLTTRHFYFDPDRPLAVLTDASAALGKAARRRLPAGEPLPSNAFEQVQLVFRGRPAVARFHHRGLTITATVLAQESGGAGELVRARNIDSGRIVSGIVAADGTIEVSTP